MTEAQVCYEFIRERALQEMQKRKEVNKEVEEMQKKFKHEHSFK